METVSPSRQSSSNGLGVHCDLREKRRKDEIFASWSAPVALRLTPRIWAFYEGALFFVCAMLISWQLFLPPNLGLADNNDFPKLIGRFCLGPASPQDHILFDYVTLSYRHDPTYCWDSGLISSAAVVLSGALQVGKLVLPVGRFDLRLLAAIYTILFLAAFHGLQRLARGLSGTARWLLPAVALFIFSGASYVPLFSSFYFDTAAYVLLLLSIVSVCRLVFRSEVRPRDYLLPAACVVLFASAKPQHALLALMLIPCFWCSFGRARFPRPPLRILAIAAIGFAVGATLTVPPRWYQSVNTYNALFYQCLPRSHDARADLVELGLNPAFLQYVGQHAFSPGTPMQNQQFIEEFGQRVPLWKIVAYYMWHPRISIQVFLYAMQEGSLQRVRMKVGQREYRLGNYPKSSGRPPGMQSHFFDVWSTLKTAIFGNHPLLYVAYAAGLVAALWTFVLRLPANLRRRAGLLAGALSGMLIVAAIIVMFDAVDTGRHLFLYNALLDVGVCGLASLLVTPALNA
jgi:hypothetical protein